MARAQPSAKVAAAAKTATPVSVSQWLKNNGLEEYTAKFEELGCDSLEAVARVKEEDLKPFMKLGHMRKTVGLIKKMHQEGTRA